MMNAMEARAMVKEAQAKENARMNEYAVYNAEAICEAIAIEAKKGNQYTTWTIQGDLDNIDMRVRVCNILRNNGFSVNVKKGYLFIAW